MSKNEIISGDFSLLVSMRSLWTNCRKGMIERDAGGTQ